MFHRSTKSKNMLNIYNWVLDLYIYYIHNTHICIWSIYTYSINNLILYVCAYKVLRYFSVIKPYFLNVIHRSVHILFLKYSLNYLPLSNMNLLALPHPLFVGTGVIASRDTLCWMSDASSSTPRAASTLSIGSQIYTFFLYILLCFQY